MTIAFAVDGIAVGAGRPTPDTVVRGVCIIADPLDAEIRAGSVDARGASRTPYAVAICAIAGVVAVDSDVRAPSVNAVSILAVGAAVHAVVVSGVRVGEPIHATTAGARGQAVDAVDLAGRIGGFAEDAASLIAIGATMHAVVLAGLGLRHAVDARSIRAGDFECLTASEGCASRLTGEVASFPRDRLLLSG